MSTPNFFLNEMQNYLEDLCRKHKDVQHEVDGRRSFSRFETDAHIHEITQNGGENIIVVADVHGGRIGDFEDQKTRHYITVIFASKAIGIDSESAVIYAVNKSEEIMYDFMAKFDLDYTDQCGVLKDLEPEKSEWQKFEGPWLDMYYGWQFTLPFKQFMLAYNPEKWLP
jgi:hypothetical protein